MRPTKSPTSELVPKHASMQVSVGRIMQTQQCPACENENTTTGASSGGRPATTPPSAPRRHAPPRQPSVTSVAVRPAAIRYVMFVVRCRPIASSVSPPAIARPRSAASTCARSYARRAADSASERAMARPPGSAQPAERALESLAKSGGRERAAELVVVEQDGRDDLAIARLERFDGFEPGAAELAFFDDARAVERGIGRGGGHEQGERDAEDADDLHVPPLGRSRGLRDSLVTR